MGTPFSLPAVEMFWCYLFLLDVRCAFPLIPTSCRRDDLGPVNTDKDGMFGSSFSFRKASRREVLKVALCVSCKEVPRVGHHLTFAKHGKWNLMMKPECNITDASLPPVLFIS